MILKDYDAVQAIYHSPLLTTLTTHDNLQINYQNATGYVLQINSGLMDICAYLRQPNHLSFGPGRCKQTIARPAIGNIHIFPIFEGKKSIFLGLAIVGVIFLVIGIVCTGKSISFLFVFISIVCIGFADEERCNERKTRWLSYCSAISVALGGLLLFTSHWTYSISSELQFPTAFVRYGYSTYLMVTAAVTSLLSMSLVLWRIVSVYCCPVK